MKERFLLFIIIYVGFLLSGEVFAMGTNNNQLSVTPTTLTPTPSPTSMQTYKLTPAYTPTSTSTLGQMHILTPTPTHMQKQTGNSIKTGYSLCPIRWGNKNLSEISLTFDDGYTKKSIEEVLTVLKMHGIKSTFFVIGKELIEYPDLWKRAVKDGHQICTHTYTHTFLSSLSDKVVENEIINWEKAAQRVLDSDYVSKMKK